MPRALQPVLGTAHVWRSLKTSDRTRAQVRAQFEYQEIENAFGRTRLELNAIENFGMLDTLRLECQHGRHGAVQLLRAHHVEALIQRYRSIMLACDDEERRAIGSQPPHERRQALQERKALLQEAREQLREAAIGEDALAIRETAETLVEAEGPRRMRLLRRSMHDSSLIGAGHWLCRSNRRGAAKAN